MAAAPKPLGRTGAVVDDGGDDAESDATPPSSDSPSTVTAATAPTARPHFRSLDQLASSAQEMMLGGVGGAKEKEGSIGSSENSHGRGRGFVTEGRAL